MKCLWCVFVLVVFVNGDQRCLRDFSVVGSTPETITVAWNYTCTDR